MRNPEGESDHGPLRLLFDCPSHLFHLWQKPWNFASPPDTLSGMHKIIEIFADRAALHTEILALRQQVAVLKRQRPRPSLRCMEPRWCDRPFPGWLADPDCVCFAARIERLSASICMAISVCWDWNVRAVSLPPLSLLTRAMAVSPSALNP